MEYKRYLKNQKIRFALLSFFSWVPDGAMLSFQYRLKLGRRLDLKNSQRWTEKIQLYKMRYRNPLLLQCVDKYSVRDYVRNKGLGNHLVNLYGVYNNVDDIPFDDLPNSFVLKTTGGGGGLNVAIVKEKKNQNIDVIKKNLASWQETVGSQGGREWAYSGIKASRIIAEELLINRENPDAGVEDFKILCFNGAPNYIIVDKDRFIDHKRNIYTTTWERVDVTTDHNQFYPDYPKPNNLNEMLDIATILSQDFPFVRVDLYNIDGKVYFGELTFYPWSGYVQFIPDSFDFTLGRLLDTASFK